jgi:hypothetical protein
MTTRPLILNDTSSVSPSIAVCNGNLYMAWKGDGNDDVNVMLIPDKGMVASFNEDANKFHHPADSSSDSPALASDGSTLFIAYKRSDNHNLHVSTVVLDPVTGVPKGITPAGSLSDTSDVRPALAVLDGRVYLAWKGDGNDNLNVMVSTDAGPAGASFSGVNRFTSVETSSVAPTLGTYDNSLFIGWKGDGNDNLNVATVPFDPVSGRPFYILPPDVLGDTSPVNPALAGLNGNLYLAWKGDGNDNLNVMVSTNEGATFFGKTISPQTSSDAPALATDGTTLFIAWKGSGNDNLNVARVETISASIERTGFALTGSGWTPGTTVDAMWFYSGGDPNQGGQGTFPVAADGTFDAFVEFNVFGISGKLFVQAQDKASGQSAQTNVSNLGG